MVWVEARAFGVSLAAIAAFMAFIVVSSRLHAQAGGAAFFAMVILATVFIGGEAWSRGLDRGRKARYAPTVFNVLSIGGGALAVILQLGNGAAMEDLRHGAIAALAGAVTLIFAALMLRYAARGVFLLRAARSRKAKGRTRDTLRA